MPTTNFINVAGKNTQLTVGGDGPPLLYLHSAAGETEWIPMIEQLAKHFTVYLPAHPGFATSAGLEQIRDIHDLAWHYVDLMDQLGLSNVPVVGYSLGGWLGCELAILRPRLIRRMVLIASAGIHVPGAPMAELFIDDLPALRRLLFLDENGPLARSVLPSGIDDPRIVHWLRAREATARVGWSPYLHNPRLAGHLKRIEAPTLVIWGRHDRLIPLAHGEFFAEHIPGSKLIVLEDAAHMVPHEKPEVCAGLAVDFLQS